MSREGVTELQQIPNVGPAVAADLRALGVNTPSDLVGQDAYALYDQLGKITGRRQDPCVIDVFISAIRFMSGEPARPWWKYTAERKARLGTAADVPRRRVR